LPIAYVQLHPGAQVTADELMRYAAEHIPERPAVPKEIVVLEKLPLTSVGKPMKHVLQLDAAKRVFNAALSPLSCAWELNIVNTGGSGLAITLLLKDAKESARAAAEQILSAYSIPYVIEV
jgi:fatty-acyl-CoA synthase